MYHLVILLFILASSVLAQDSQGNAVIFNASSTALSSDVIYLQGSGFGTAPHIQYSFNNGSWVTLTPLTSGNEAAMVQMPSTSQLPDLLTLRVSPDGYHWSAPVYVNQAKVLSIDTAQIGPGNRFRLFGRNLLFSRTPTVRLVDTANGASYSASPDTSNSTTYNLAAIAPSGIVPNHTYQVFVSNGYNGSASSGGETVAPITLQGRSSGTDYFHLGVPWASDLNFTNNVYNVQTDPRLPQHARGDGSASDRDAISAAVNAASNDGGGIVYLPAGTYNLHFYNGCGITLFSRVILVGQDAGSTFVNYGFGPAPNSGTGYAVCFAPSQSGVADITFTNVNESGSWPESAIAHGSSEVFLQRTNWNISTAQWLVFEQSTNATIQNSTLIQGLDPSYNGPVNGSGSTNLLLRNNTIQYAAGSIFLDHAENAVLEGNKITRDVSQPAPSWVITHVIAANFVQNFAFLNNTLAVSGGTLPLTNDGESLGSEAGGAQRFDEFRGVVESASSNSIHDSSQNFNWSSNNAVPNLRPGAIIAIVAGAGTGQWATISSVSSDGHTVYTNQPWAVQPARGSHYATFDWSAANWIIAGNTMSDNEKGIEIFNASARDILITGNQLTNNSGILISPTEQPGGAGLFNVVLNTQITNNTLTDTNHLRPAAISIVPREDYQNNNFGTAVIGVELRGNSITGYTPNTRIAQTSLDDSKALTEGFNIYWQWQTLTGFLDDGIPSVLATVIQGNSLTNSTAALETNSGVYQTVLASNNTSNVATMMVNNTLPGAIHAAMEIVNLATVISNAAPAAAIVAPVPVAAPPVAALAWKQVSVGSLPASTLAAEPASNTSFSLLPSLYSSSNAGDSLSFLAETVSADTSATARITVPPQTSAATMGLITFRNYSLPLSAFVSLGQLQTGDLFFQYRPYFGGAVGTWSMPHAQSPIWVKLTKTGNLFQAIYSDDGTTWHYAVSIGASFGDNTYSIGLASLSDTNSGPALTFDGVTVP